MNRFALLTLYRSLTRHKLYAALNIGGLGVGIAVFLVLALYVRFETSYEKWLPDHDQIYLVQTENVLVPGFQSGTMSGMLEQLKVDFPDVRGTRIRGATANVIRNGIATAEQAVQVDATFLDTFALPIVRGAAAGALANPSSLLIDQAMAEKYFPGTDPVGRPLKISVAGVTAVYRVSAVFRNVPANSDFEYNLVARLPDGPKSADWYDWSTRSLVTYLRFATPAAAQAFSRNFPDFVQRHGTANLGPDAKTRYHFRLMPLTDRHLSKSIDKLTVTALGIVGLLTLLIAVVNYVNLATARAGMRAREVAMRKVLGADRAALVRQFLGEAVLTVILAALVGLIIVELGLPAVNAAGGLSLSIPYAILAPALAGLAIVVGGMAGSYPALLLSRFPAAAVLAAARSPGGGRSGTRVRETLVVFQFALTIAFIIGTSVLTAQTRHLRSSDLGFQRDGLLVVSSFSDNALTEPQRKTLSAAIAGIPSVGSSTVADTAAGDRLNNSNDVIWHGKDLQLQRVEVGPEFFKTYGARLMAGRLFDNDHRTDDTADRQWDDSGSYNIVINRRAASALGFASPADAVGTTISGGGHPRTIVGVIDDLRLFSPRDPLMPAYYKYGTRGPAANSILTLRFSGDPRTTMGAVRATWQRIAPQVSFEAKTASQRLATYYEADERVARLFGIGSGLAVLIGCVGLWGLASFNTARRVKEIGIRKVLGASSTDIVKLLIGQFLRPVLIANLFAWPLAYIAMRAWLAGFDDRIALSPLYFIGASLVAIVIAVLTVLAQSLRASRAAPAWALRHE